MLCGYSRIYQNAGQEHCKHLKHIILWCKPNVMERTPTLSLWPNLLAISIQVLYMYASNYKTSIIFGLILINPQCREFAFWQFSLAILSSLSCHTFFVQFNLHCNFINFHIFSIWMLQKHLLRPCGTMSQWTQRSWASALVMSSRSSVGQTLIGGGVRSATG